MCEDGIVVYADTEWTSSTLKTQRGKHWRLGAADRLKCVIAGAGDEDNLRMAIQGFWATLLNIDEAKIRTSDVHNALEAVLSDVYNKHVYPDPKGAAREFGVIMAVWTPDDPPLLFKTTGTGILVSQDYEYVYIGSGTEMAMYLSSRLDVRGVPTSVGELIAAFILWEVKQHVQTCGGNSVIYRLLKDGRLQCRGEGDILDFEHYFSTIDRKVQRIRVHTANLEQSNEEFERKLAGFCDDLRALRKVRLEKLELEKDLTS